MATSNNNKNYNREIEQESYYDPNGGTREVTRISEVETKDGDTYSQGYIHGKAAERSYQKSSLVQRDNDNAARGLILGLLLASLAALVGGFVWYVNERNEDAIEPVNPLIVPVPDRSQPNPSPSPSPQSQQQPQQKTVVIEKVKEVPVTKEVPVVVEKTKEVPVPVPVPVPQQQTPQTPTSTQPVVPYSQSPVTGSTTTQPLTPSSPPSNTNTTTWTTPTSDRISNPNPSSNEIDTDTPSNTDSLGTTPNQ